MSVLSGRVWSISCFVRTYGFSQSSAPCLLPPPIPLCSSWTEDTRSCIFSDTALHLGKDGQRPLAAELDLQIEQKFEEFDELADTGRNLLDKGHHLTQMVSLNVDSLRSFNKLLYLSTFTTLSNVLQVRERMEELRSMLGWISVHWRAQKQQSLHKMGRDEPSQDNIYSEATMCSTLTEVHKHKGIYSRDSHWSLEKNQAKVLKNLKKIVPCQVLHLY